MTKYRLPGHKKVQSDKEGSRNQVCRRSTSAFWSSARLDCLLFLKNREGRSQKRWEGGGERGEALNALVRCLYDVYLAFPRCCCVGVAPCTEQPMNAGGISPPHSIIDQVVYLLDR